MVALSPKPRGSWNSIGFPLDFPQQAVFVGGYDGYDRYDLLQDGLQSEGREGPGCTRSDDPNRGSSFLDHGSHLSTHVEAMAFIARSLAHVLSLCFQRFITFYTFFFNVPMSNGSYLRLGNFRVAIAPVEVCFWMTVGSSENRLPPNLLVGNLILGEHLGYTPFLVKPSAIHQLKNLKSLSTYV